MMVLWWASTVKYTTPLPFIHSIEINSYLYTNFEIYDGKYHKRLKNTLIYKSHQFMLTIFLKKILHIVEDGASSVQVDILDM